VIDSFGAWGLIWRGCAGLRPAIAIRLSWGSYRRRAAGRAIEYTQRMMKNRTPVKVLGRARAGARVCRRLALVVVAGAVMAGCAAAPQSGSTIAELPPCEVVQTLIDSFAEGFAQLRGAQSDNRYADIWTAKHHAVGNHCEVWDSGRNQFVYICSRSFPNAQAAQLDYAAAATTVRGCLGADWQQTGGDRGDGRGEYIRFTRDAGGVAVTIQKVRGDSLMRDQWTVYYLVGDQSARQP
jgi:hypothetical protein